MYGDDFRRGDLSDVEVFALVAILPAAAASAGNALLGRDLGAVVRAGILGAVVCAIGLLLLILIFFLIVPPEFFT